MNKVIITDAEVQDMPYSFGNEIDYMNLLREKGVPIKGLFYPELDTDNYTFHTYRHNGAFLKEIGWKKK